MSSYLSQLSDEGTGLQLMEAKQMVVLAMTMINLIIMHELLGM